MSASPDDADPNDPICLRNEFFAGSPMENEYVLMALSASANSECSTSSAAMDVPAVPSSEHPTRRCSTSPSILASASALCAEAPAVSTPKCAASDSSL